MNICLGIERYEDIFARTLGNYRVTPKVSDLGWVDLDLGSSLGWWAATIATYCPSRMMEHLIPISTQPRSETFWVTLYCTRALLSIS